MHCAVRQLGYRRRARRLQCRGGNQRDRSARGVEVLQPDRHTWRKHRGEQLNCLMLWNVVGAYFSFDQPTTSRLGPSRHPVLCLLTRHHSNLPTDSAILTSTLNVISTLNSPSSPAENPVDTASDLSKIGTPPLPLLAIYHQLHLAHTTLTRRDVGASPILIQTVCNISTALNPRWRGLTIQYRRSRCLYIDLGIFDFSLHSDYGYDSGFDGRHAETNTVRSEPEQSSGLSTFLQVSARVHHISMTRRKADRSTRSFLPGERSMAEAWSGVEWM